MHAKEMPQAASTVSPPSGSGSTEPDIPSAQMFMSTVELAPECDDKEAHAEIMQSPVSTTEVLQSQNTSPVKKSFLQPVMDAPLKLKEILMDQKVPPRVQPLLNWPPDPSFGKELAARIREEKEAFSKAYGVVFEPGRSLKIAVAQRGSERSCVSSSRDEAIRSHNECKTEDTKPAVQLNTATDDSNIEERQEPSEIFAEVVDVRDIVHHEKQEAGASGHSGGAVYEETSEGQQEANVHASVSKGASSEQVDAGTCDSILPQPKMSHPGPKKCKLKERHGTAQASDTNNSPEKHVDESGKPAEVMKMKHHIVSNSKHEKSSLNPEPAIRMKGRTRESRRPQPRVLDTTRESRKTVLQEALRDSETVVRCEQKQPKGDTAWADRVKQLPKVTNGSPPEQSDARIAHLEQENAQLRAALEQLRAEFQSLRRSGSSAPPAPAPRELPAETPTPARSAKKRALTAQLRVKGTSRNSEVRLEIP
ncbi:hypothetical protein HPB50_011126 [Hyalomma asiaticum]|uniref:Uncharacterized protein n=1 Tax=Hyalomma asiaticum TaxID=266040 RepID=A0ACB7S203_HYAAI|nr:hypothetical protein HPB50_011126 [Hyalomma asiaticum]